MNLQLVIVDPQNDFCDSKGTLYVAGGEKDMERVAKMIDRLGGKLDDIHCARTKASLGTSRTFSKFSLSSNSFTFILSACPKNNQLS